LEQIKQIITSQAVHNLRSLELDSVVTGWFSDYHKTGTEWCPWHTETVKFPTTVPFLYDVLATMGLPCFFMKSSK
jgi:hypothetical protein